MQAFYDNKPSVLEAVGNGSYLYRTDIKEVETDGNAADTDTEEKRTQWQCEEITVWSPITSNRITEAAITERWAANYEQKLVNEYNAAKLGLYGSTTSAEAKEHIQKYTDYLTERAALKTQIDADCEALGIA